MCLSFERAITHCLDSDIFEVRIKRVRMHVPIAEFLDACLTALYFDQIWTALKVQNFSFHGHEGQKLMFTSIFTVIWRDTCSQGASYRYSPWPGPAPLATGISSPFAVGPADFALDKTVLSREGPLSEGRIFFWILNFAGWILTGYFTVPIPSPRVFFSFWS